MSTEALNATFAALADPTRRAIVERLAQGSATVKELAEPFEISGPAISRHLRVLEDAGLVITGQDAQRRPRTLNTETLGEVSAWLERYRGVWEARHDRLATILASAQEKGPTP